MKYLLIALVIAAAVGCGDYERAKDDSGREVSAPGLVRYRIDTVTVRGCQYIIADHWESGAIIHAGDCNNPIHVPPGGNLGTIRYDGIVRLDSLPYYQRSGDSIHIRQHTPTLTH
jgi:hypothetical protein